jgi:hypothetical protein
MFWLLSISDFAHESAKDGVIFGYSYNVLSYNVLGLGNQVRMRLEPIFGFLDTDVRIIRFFSSVRLLRHSLCPNAA